MSDFEIYKKVVTLPDHMKAEVNDFVEQLLAKITNEESRGKRVGGLAKGLIHLSDDFDAPLDDFKDYM